MQKEHRDAIQRNFSSLVEQTDLELMVAALYEKGVFSEPMMEPYRDISKDARTRKRRLYMDITRRGPDAFGHLLDALSENGYWDLVRDLDPGSSLHARNTRPAQSQVGESSFLSISNKKKSSSGKEQNDRNRNQASGSTGLRNSSGPDSLQSEPERNGNSESPSSSDTRGIPHFNVIKSTKFFEDNDSDIKLYRTRGRQRGVLVIFNYVSFKHDIEEHRRGAHVDADNLRYLFDELGFKVLFYRNLSLEMTKRTLSSLKQTSCAEAETVFIVFSSHGYRRPGTGDTDIRCHDGGLVSFYDIIEYFNNDKFPALRGVPKVFIFQTCRGPNKDFTAVPPRHLPAPAAARPATLHDGPPDAPAAPTPAPARTAHDGRRYVDDEGEGDQSHDRMYSDILIAHSTVPGYVSNRDESLGSWYIQALCSVFAARAHDCHVEKLFTLVDQLLQKKFTTQTSSVDRWGFNRRLYLHPGMYED